MKLIQLTVTSLLLATGLMATKKVISPTTTAGNDDLDITATLTMLPSEVVQKLGADPGPGIVLLQVRVAPKTDKPIQVSPEDFILLAHDDGQKSRPFEPSQLAGKGSMVVKSGPNGNTVHQGPSTSFGGLSIHRSKDDSKKKDDSTPAPEVNDKDSGNETLLARLRAKQLPGRESSEPVEGYLYFPLDGRHKLKNMAVLYRGPGGKLDLEFEH